MHLGTVRWQLSLRGWRRWFTVALFGFARILSKWLVMQSSQSENRWLALGFFIAAISLRLLPHWPNFSPIAALALFAGCYLSSRSGLILAFGAMAMSDWAGHYFELPGMGFYHWSTMLTVYFSLSISAVIGRWLRGNVRLVTVPLASVAGTMVFFLSTNFASWLDPLMQYPQTLSGLVACYTAAIPFLGNSLLGDLFYSSLLFGLYAALVAPWRQSSTSTAPATAQIN